ncbi:radical SAM protein [Fusobacterium sp. IOR10]|uniref:radical SAM protein n=1 Tax=Fusobacterium sp. IOR10 TaxID=2665157 RepID=UPI0013D0856E|nr:radical SAM protein [Fusobacterium sp. IOR10]
MGIRYNKIQDKHRREIVLLKSFPCAYGKCSFCNYIEDNSLDEDSMDIINRDTIKNITGEFGVLEVINSGSVFELTDETMKMIKDVVYEKNIKIIYFEIYYGYLKRLDEIRKLFPGVEVRIRMGLETFNEDFRINHYNKNFKLNEDILKLLGKEIYSICLLVCTKGQTKKMIDRDIELGLKYFKNITLNIFIDNGTIVKRDENLVKWFIEKYSYLQDDDRVELLINNKDLGVFEQ